MVSTLLLTTYIPYSIQRAYIHNCTCIHTYIHIYLHIFIHAYIRMKMFIHTHYILHAYIHTYMCLPIIFLPVDLSVLYTTSLPPSLCRYKLVQLCWPGASTMFDVGGNKGYLGALFLALWFMRMMLMRMIMIDTLLDVCMYCMYVCTDRCMYIHLYVQMYVCIVCVCTWLRARRNLFETSFLKLSVCMYVCMYVCRGGNGLRMNPSVVFEQATKLNTWKNSRNPAGYCKVCMYSMYVCMHACYDCDR